MEPFDRAKAAAVARRLVRTARDAAFGTLDDDGAPHVSHVATATLADGAPTLLISDLALHTRHARREPRTSLLFVATEGESADTNTRARVTLTGRIGDAPDRAAARDRLLRRHPEASLYVDFADFHLIRFAPERAHLVAGFGRIVDLAPDDLLAPEGAAAALGEIDADACRHMNEDHRDALALMATRLAGAPDGDWRAIGVDPEGVDLAADGRIVRAEFDATVQEAGALRVALKRLADRARATEPD